MLNVRPIVLSACLLALSTTSCRETDPPSDDWQIVPGQRLGRVSVPFTEKELIGAYGAAAVERTRVELGEGETAPGTILFGADSLGRLEILWQDTVTRTRPLQVILRGTAGRWRLPPGIGLGTRLRRLEQYNQRAFTLAGFGWDYEGVVIDWKGGALARLLPGVRLYLDPASAQRTAPVYQAVLGDREYPSSAEPMQALDPGVYQIFVDFELSPAQ